MSALRSASLPMWAVLGAVLGVTIIAKLHLGVPWSDLMGDPAKVTGRPFYLGFVSNVGALLWAAAASLFLFTYRVLRARRDAGAWRRFLLCSGLFVALLGIDDLFMLHDQVFPDYLSVSQTLVVAGYAVLALLYLLRFAPLLRQTAYPILLVAVSLLAASAGLDQMQDHFSIAFFGSGFLEDAAKLLGIGTWLSYAIHTSESLLQPSPALPRMTMAREAAAPARAAGLTTAWLP